MVAPLLVAGATLGSIYTIGKAVDNERYWRDYANRTGKVPKYPWRVGRYDAFKYGAGLATLYGRGFSKPTYYHSHYHITRNYHHYDSRRYYGN